MKLVRVVVLIVFILSSIFAGALGWSFYFGDCADGCSEGMAFIFLLPALILSGLTGLAYLGMYTYDKRNR